MQSSTSASTSATSSSPVFTFQQVQEVAQAQAQEQERLKRIREEGAEELKEQSESSLQTFFQLKNFVMPRLSTLDRVKTCCAFDDTFCPRGAIAAKIKLFLNELDEDLIVNGKFEKGTPKETRDLILFQSELRSLLVDIEAGVPREQFGARWTHAITNPDTVRNLGGRTRSSNGAAFFYVLMYHASSVHELRGEFNYI